jgi:uncharacterized protein (TIGR00270 family)
MVSCELCGSKDARFDAEIEGTMMHVCEGCARFGKVKHSSKAKILVEEKKTAPQEPVYLFIQGYGSIIKKSRERLGLKQEEFGKRLNIKESMLHQLESEHFKPDIELAHRLEKELHIKIVEEIKPGPQDGSEASGSTGKKNAGTLTLGDMIKIKKR